MKLRLLFLSLLLPAPLLAQTGAVTGVALDSVGNTVAGATITVCPQGSSGIPCSPVTASTTSNGQGAFSVTVAVGTYTVTVFRLGVVATSSTIVVAPSNITVANNVNYTGSVTFSGTLTVTGALTCTIVNVVRCISPSNPQGWAGSDPGAWLNSAAVCSGGCQIQIAAGNYQITTPIVLPHNVQLVGSGRGNVTSDTPLTLLQEANGVNLAALITASGTNVSIRDMYIDGNKANNSTALDGVVVSQVKFTMVNVTVDSFKRHNVVLAGATEDTRISLSSSVNAGTNGVEIQSGATDLHMTTDVVVNNGNNNVHGSGTIGGLHFIGGDYSGIAGASDCIFLDGTAGAVNTPEIVGVAINPCPGNAIRLINANSPVVSGSYINNPGAGTNNTFDGVQINNFGNAIVSGNSIADGSTACSGHSCMRYGVNVIAATQKNELGPNAILGPQTAAYNPTSLDDVLGGPSGTTNIIRNPLTVTGALNANGGIAGAGKFDGNCLVDGVQNATLAAAVTCAGTNGVIEIPMFAVPTLTAGVTVPAGVVLRFDGPSPGVINLGNFNLTINGPIVAPNAQLFVYSGSGVVSFGTNANPANVVWFPGATADVQITRCLAAIVTGSCDARGFGATTQSIAAQITVNASQTLIFDSSTTWQAASSSLNTFSIKSQASVLGGFHFDCGNQPAYTGTVFSFLDTYSDANRTTVENVRITCRTVNTGIGALFSANGTGNQDIAFVTLRNWRVYGLLDGIKLTATNNGFANGNHFEDIEFDNTVHGIHYALNGGQLSGNICNPCSYEAVIGGAGVNGILYDGTTGATDSATNNMYVGDIWDAPTNPINYNNSKAFANVVMGGNITGTVLDPNNSNTFFSSGTLKLSNLLNLAAGVTFQINGNLLLSQTAPTISTHFNTSGDSIAANGTASITITVGTGAGTSTGVIALPTASNGWNCWLTNQNRAALIQQTGSTTASATFTNFGTTFVATNWTNSDVLRGGCTAN